MWRIGGCCAGVLVLVLVACTATSTKTEGAGGDGGSESSGGAGGGGGGGSAGTSGSNGVGAAPATGGTSSGSGGVSGTGAAMGSGGDAGGGTSGTGGSGGTGDCSDPRANTRCEGDSLYYETSCGELGELIEECCGGCGVRFCNAPRLCVDGDLYASDDCVEPTQKLVECSNGTCNKYVCECNFEDANLERGVRAALGVPAAPLTDVETGVLQRLDLDEPATGTVSSLNGIECLYELRQLDMVGEHQLTDLSPLLALPDLEQLSGQQLTLTPGALAVIGEMTKLRLVVLHDTNITSLPSLELLTVLYTLELDGGAISDLSGIADAPNLTLLSLANNNITDLTPLASMSSLLALYLEGNPITDLSPLLALPPLSTLSLRGTSIDCTEQASNLAELRSKHANVSDDC